MSDPLEEMIKETPKGLDGSQVHSIVNSAVSREFHAVMMRLEKMDAKLNKLLKEKGE